MASLLAILAGGIIALGPSGCAESFLFYFPSRRAFDDAPGAEPVTFKTSDGLSLSGWFFAATPGQSDGQGDAGADRGPGGHTPPPESGITRDSTTQRATEQAADAARELAEEIASQGVQEHTPAVEPGSIPRPTILVAHGNAGCLPDHDQFCSFLASHGFNVLLFDYRGYGRSDLPKRGLQRADLVVDTHAAFDYLLTRQDVDPERIALLGYSLGGNIGLGFAADQPRIRAVATVATFARWQEVAGDHGGGLGRFLIPAGMDAADSVARLGDRPYLIVHGDADDIVPFRHAALLESAATAAGITVTRLDVPGANHINMTEREEVQRAIAAFFTNAIRPPDPDDP